MIPRHHLGFQTITTYVLPVAVLVCGFFFVVTLTASAATYTWDGGGSTNDWSECANWTSNTCPGSADIAQFDSTSVKNATVDASFGGTVLGVAVNAGYTGIITQARNLTIGSSNFTMASGTWSAGTTTFDLNGSFTQTGGTFFAAAGTSTIQGNITLSGGTMTASSTRVLEFDDSGVNQTSTLTCTGNFPTGIKISKDSNGSSFVTGLGCLATTTGNVLLFANTSSNLTVNGVLVISQTATTSIYGSVTIGSSGQLTINSDLAVISNFTISNGGVFTHNGYRLQLYDLGTSQGSVVTCSGAFPTPIQLNKDSNGGSVTIASGCAATTTDTVVLGGATATDLNINGTLVIAQTSTTTVLGVVIVGASGSLTINADLIVNAGFTLAGGGVFNTNGYRVRFTDYATSQPGVLTCTGAFPATIQIDKDSNGGDFTIAAGCAATTTGTVVLTGGTATDLNINGTLNIIQTSTTIVFGTVTVGASGALIINAELLVFLSFSLASGGTFTSNGFAVEFGDYASSQSSTLTCTGEFPTLIRILKDANGSDFTLAGGCAATTTGTVVLTGGASTDLSVNGTLSIPSSATTTVGGSVTVSGSLSSGADIQVGLDFTLIGGGSFYASGQQVAFVDTFFGQHSTLTCAGLFSASLLIMKDNNADNSFTLSSGCTATATAVIVGNTLAINGTFYHPAGTSTVGYFVVNGTTTLAGDVSVMFDATIAAAATVYNSGNHQLHFRDTFFGQYSTFTCTGPSPIPIDVYKDHGNDNTFTLSSGCIATSSRLIADAGVTINGTVHFTQNVVNERGFTTAVGARTVLSGWNLSAQTHTVNGTLVLNGTETVTTPTSGDSSTVEYAGTSTYTTLSGITDFESLAFSGGGTYTISSSLTVEDNFTSTNNSNFVMTSSGSITFDGGNQTVTGTSTFNNFTKVVTATSTLTFGAGQEQTLNGDTTLTGTLAAPLQLRSTASGTQYFLDVNGAHSIEYVSLQDANNTNATIATCYPGCTDVANNTNFTFEGDVLSGLRRWDGGGADTLWSTAANWEFDQVPAPTETVVFATTSLKNSTIDPAFGGTIGGIVITPGYTGTVSASTSLTITTDGLSLADGTFVAPTTTLLITGGFTQLPGSTFSSVGTVTITDLSTTTLVVNGASFRNIVLGSSPTQDASLTAYWKLDEGTGSAISDASGNGETATLQNMENSDWSSAVPVIGYLPTNPYALNFDGSDEYALANIDIGSSWTISSWFKWPLPVGTSGGWNTLTRASENGDHQIIVRQSDNLLGGFYGGFLSSGFDMDTLSTGWHHLAVVGTSSSQLYYIDGVYVGTIGAKSTSNIYAVGNFQSGGQQWGWVDDFRVYGTTALSVDEIDRLAETNPAGGTTVASSSLALSGNLTISSALDLSTSSCSGANSCNLQVGGDFINNGTFIPRTGTVTFTGGTQSISGTTTFYNLVKTNGTGTLAIQASSLQTVQNDLILSGSSTTGLKIRSTATGTPYRLTVGGTETLSYLDLRDANNTGATLDCATLCLDLGGNTGFDFGAGLFPGKRRWDGGGTTTLWSTAENWQFDEVPSSAETVVFDTTSTKNSDITTAFGATIAGIALDTGYTGTVTASTTNFTLTGNGLTIKSGTFVAPTGLLVLDNTTLSQVGGVYTTQSGALSVKGTSTVSLQQPIHNIDFSNDVDVVTPLARWRFDESSATATVLNAASSTFATGTPNGTGGTNSRPQPVAVTSSLITYTNPLSKDFDGTDDTVTVEGINVANRSFTVMAWVKRRNTGGWEIVFGQGVSSNGSGLHIGFNNNAFICNFWGYDFATGSYTDTDWNHWACTYDAASNRRTAYRNGVEIGFNTPAVDYVGTGTFTIGSSPLIGGSHFEGNLDDVRVYDSALSSTSITTIYQSDVSTGRLLIATTTLNAAGDVIIRRGSTIDVGMTTCGGSSCSLAVAGNFTNQGTYLARAGTTTFSGIAAQTATGTLSATSSFHNLEITNTTGPVSFGAPLNVAGTFTMGPDTAATFLANATHTVERLDWDGESTGSRITLRSTNPGTEWILVPNTIATTSYIDVEDSYNASTTNIQCVDGCADGGNNTAWDFPLSAGFLVLTDHPEGQPDNQFTFQNKDDVPLFGFTLAPDTEGGVVDDVVLSLRGVRNLTTANLIDLRLYRDANNDGLLDGGDTQVLGAGIFAIDGEGGTITFSTGTTSVSTTTRFVVTGDTVTIKNGMMATFDLASANITAVGASTSLPMLTIGSVATVQHVRTGNAPDGSSGQIGGDAPAGVVRSGGQSGGGQGDLESGQQLDGENITPDPDFFRPTNTGTPHNEWTGGANAYSSDGTYATAASANLRQTYGGFGFTIPGSNTIQGIQVKLDGSGSTAAGTIQVALSWDGGTTITALEATPTLSGSDIVYTLGGQTNLWGRSWTATDLNDTNFRLRIVSQPSGNTVRLDAIEVRVYHTAGGGGQGGGEQEL